MKGTLSIIPAFRILRELVIPTVAILLLSCEKSERLPPAPQRNSSVTEVDAKTPLSVKPDPVTLGVIPTGEKARATLLIINPGSERLELTNVRTTCPCVGLEGLPVSIEPGKSVELRVTFDPTEEPNFRGTLEVGLIGLGATGGKLFQTKVNLTIKG